MSNRIESNLTTQLNPFGPQWQTTDAKEAKEVGQQVQQVLFGAVKPPVLDPLRFPELAAMLRSMGLLKKKLATLAGDKEDDYDIVLADGTIAMIDENGTIFLGAGFLRANLDKPEVVAGALAHEIGHRPKRWSQYKTRRTLSREELEILCRHEETRADIFAGKALAELGMSCEPLCEFLQRIDTQPHPAYFSADVRSAVIRDAHTGRSYRAENRKKIFPEFDRMTSTKGHLGEY